jgi:hypothetical protein
MKRVVCICVILLLAVSKGYNAMKPPDTSKVQFEIMRLSKDAGLAHLEDHE